MAAPKRTFEQLADRIARLTELGLTEVLVVEIVERGLAARMSCTAFHPPSYPGLSQWAEMVQAARLLLVPSGWTPDDDRCFSRVVSPDRRMAIAISTGDARTGLSGLPEPSTKYPRGTETDHAIAINRQLSLFDNPAAMLENISPRPRRETWTLLVATSPSHVRFELSRGSEQDKQGRIIGWSERILFPPLEIDPASPPPGDDDSDGPDGIDVPVERL